MFRTARQSLVLLLTRLSTDWCWWRLEKCAALANTALLLSRIVRCLSRKLRSPPCLVTSLVWIEERTPRLSISSNWQTQKGREKLWDVGGFRVMCESQGMFWRSQPALINNRKTHLSQSSHLIPQTIIINAILKIHLNYPNLLIFFCCQLISWRRKHTLQTFSTTPGMLQLLIEMDIL